MLQVVPAGLLVLQVDPGGWTVLQVEPGGWTDTLFLFTTCPSGVISIVSMVFLFSLSVGHIGLSSEILIYYSLYLLLQKKT